LDQIDILLSLKVVNLRNHGFKGIETSSEIKKQVSATRGRQYCRYGSVPFEELIKKSPLKPEQQKDLQKLSIQKGLSNRVQIKII
jgi:magnesium chelatase family protein